MSRFPATAAFLLTLAAAGGALADEPKVRMETSVGTITIELFPDKAPATVKNFLGYADEGFYNGTVFHRVIPGFMIQGGGYTPQMQEKPTHAPIKNEADNGLKNDRGTIAMARTSEPNSATSQFFINLKSNDFLNHTGKSLRGWGYAVFGKVISGMDVVDKIAAVTTGTHPKGLKDVPKTPVVIEKVTRIGSAGAAK
jgi:cyclophilin family peptidyl-prolyl cis-trans isomerase